MKNKPGNEDERNKNVPSPTVNTGNASNPSPQDNTFVQANRNQLLDRKAEKYIREAGNIEDMPDPQEEQDAERNLKSDNK
jgi:hypothetical protein